MSSPSKSHELTKAEESDLDRLSESSGFWARVRAAYAEWGTLTARQYTLLIQEREKGAWRRDALRVDGKPVRNRFTGADGRPLCANRAKPWCREPATVVVGAFGYCDGHAGAARTEWDAWIAGREAQTGEQSAPTPSIPPASTSRLARMMNEMLEEQRDDAWF